MLIVLVLCSNQKHVVLEHYDHNVKRTLSRYKAIIEIKVMYQFLLPHDLHVQGSVRACISKCELWARVHCFVVMASDCNYPERSSVQQQD